MTSSSPSLISVVVACAGVIVAVAAVTMTARVSRSQRSNSTWWEIYGEYQREAVKNGRLLALAVLKETNGVGFRSHDDYAKYFGHEDIANRGGIFDKQYLHDLAAFYNLVGVLVQKRQLDKDFILLLIGQGLEDRWSVFDAFADFYPSADEVPYGGMYWLYSEYLTWKTSSYTKYSKRFSTAKSKIRASRKRVSTSMP